MMRIPAWRVALTGTALIVLLTAGLGLALASGTVIDEQARRNAAAASGEPDASGRPVRDQQRDQLRPVRWQALGARIARLGRHLVHAEITVVDRDGNLLALQLDHGTIGAIGSTSLSIEEADGSTVVVATDDITVVRLGRELGRLSDLVVGDEVIVHSRLDDDGALARHVIRLPAREAGD